MDGILNATLQIYIYIYIYIHIYKEKHGVPRATLQKKKREKVQQNRRKPQRSYQSKSKFLSISESDLELPSSQTKAMIG